MTPGFPHLNNLETSRSGRVGNWTFAGFCEKMGGHKNCGRSRCVNTHRLYGLTRSSAAIG